MVIFPRVVAATCPTQGETFVRDYCHFFALSENSVVLCELSGIYLYHITEPEPDRGCTGLSCEDISRTPGPWCWGSLCDFDSSNPALYTHGPRFMVRLSFGPDESGRFSVVTDHATEETVYYGDDWDEESDHRVILEGRKVLYHEDQPGDSPFITLQAALVDGSEATRHRQKPVHVRQVELEKRTGMILIAADHPTTGEIRPFARRIYLADFPK
jgi:hypothetical protein